MSQATENWLIVRSLRTTVQNAVQIQDLSPSKSLFSRYWSVKERGEFNEEWFQREYVPAFIQELHDNPQARLLLNRLYVSGKKHDILLACFCVNEALCHRSIAAGILLGAGASIACKEEYRRYWTLYRSCTP